MRDPKRTLIMRLRRRVRVDRKFDVEQIGPTTERQTCRECGHAENLEHLTTPEVAMKMIAYRSKGFVIGVCKTCSKAAAEERYPL